MSTLPSLLFPFFMYTNVFASNNDNKDFFLWNKEEKLQKSASQPFEPENDKEFATKINNVYLEKNNKKPLNFTLAVSYYLKELFSYSCHGIECYQNNVAFRVLSLVEDQIEIKKLSKLKGNHSFYQFYFSKKLMNKDVHGEISDFLDKVPLLLKLMNVSGSESLVNSHFSSSIASSISLLRDLPEESLTKLSHGLHQFPCGSSPQPMTFLQEILLAAGEIHFKLMKEHLEIEKKFKEEICFKNEIQNGTALIFLGRTPALIKLALENIISTRNKPYDFDLIELAFSGHPDSYTTRPGEKNKEEKAIIKNMLYRETLENYLSYMALKGIQKYRKLIIVDIMGTGLGMQSFFELLNKFNEERCFLDAPKQLQEYHIFALNRAFTVKNKNSSLLHTEINESSQFNITDDNHIQFIENKKLNNFYPYKIKFDQIHVGYGLLHLLLDEPNMQNFVNSSIQFPAQNWTEEGFKKLSSQKNSQHWKSLSMFISSKIKEELENEESYIFDHKNQKK